MAYERYTTPAVVLSSGGIGEGNVLLSLFTKDFGFLRASARSAREGRSKLRGSLQDFSLVEVSLVRGKDMWRVVGAQSAVNPALGESGALARPLLARLSLLLRRLLQGEEAHPELFSVLERLVTYLVRNPRLSESQLANVESIAVLRFLYHLGYLAPESAIAPFLQDTELTPEMLEAMEPVRKVAIGAINQSLAESQL